MNEIDFVIVATSETIRYEKYSEMPLDRIELFQNLVQLRMIFYDGGFHSYLDLLNKIKFGKYFFEATYPEKRDMFSIWNMPALNAVLALNPLIDSGFQCRTITNFDAEFDILCDYCSKMEKPIIGVSTTFILQWSEVGRICNKIKQTIPNAILVLGGAFVLDQFVNYGSEQFETNMRKYHIDYLLYGFNSEYDLRDLVDCLKSDGEYLHIHNLAYIDSSNNFKTHDTRVNSSQVSSYPIHWDFMNRTKHGNIIQLRTSSGCPFHCAFCNYSNMVDSYTYSSLNQVKEQLDAIDSLGGVEYLVFIDDNLNVPKKRFQQMLELLKQYRFKWYAFLRVQFIDEAIAYNMKLSGCDGVYLGLESGNNTILTGMNKKATTQDYQRGLDSLQKVGIKTFASFIVGFPGETPQTARDTIQFIEESGLDYYGLKEFYYLHSATVHDHASELGLEGEGNVWKHRTMDSVQASKLKLDMFEQINNATHIDPDTGLWGLAYLRSRGYDWKQILSLHKTVNEMIRNDNSRQWLNKAKLYTELESVIGM